MADDEYEYLLECGHKVTTSTTRVEGKKTFCESCGEPKKVKQRTK